MNSMLTYLVTAGPTREPLDPVRFLSNPSSGKMGFAVAREAKRRGARVILVAGPTAVEPPQVDEVVRVRTAVDMMGAVFEFVEEAAVLVMAAAVCDYRPANYSEEKIKKGLGSITIDLVANPDILTEVCGVRRPRVVVGFAAESDDLLENARRKLQGKDLDLVVANDITIPGAGFAGDHNAVSIVDREGNVESIPRTTKDEIAARIIDRVESLIAGR